VHVEPPGAASVSVTLPAAQATQVPRMPYLPGEHKQSKPVDKVELLGHDAVQELEPDTEKVPALQDVQAVE